MNPLFRRAAALMLLAVAVPGTARPQASNSTRSGDFGVLQITVADEERFKREWSVTTPGANLTQTTATVANKLLYTHILFFGCTADKAGKCDITAAVTFYAPDGKVENEQKGLVVWRGKAPDRPKNIYLGNVSVGFGTDGEGPFGVHRAVFRITDNVAGIVLTTEQALTVSPAK